MRFLLALRQGYIDAPLLRVFERQVGVKDAWKTYSEFAIESAVERIHRKADEGRQAQN